MQAVNKLSVDTETFQASLANPQEPSIEAFLANVNSYPGVDAEPKPTAAVCGSNSCRETEHLSQVQIEGFGQRVLCPRHVVDLVKREVDSA